ncbi:MAG TPA: TIGR03435 family protein [Bryobacteraceae bacterium]|nr:TIGR03435 family protein [Bryobacteraceae bacterium]
MKLRTLLILVAAGTGMGQSQSSVFRPQFDVVSVKPHIGVERAVNIDFPSPGRFEARNVWLRFVIQTAWNVKDYQVVSGPGWAASDRYDIEAKTDPKTSREQMRLMIQALLQGRFQLVLHHESRSLPVYHLVAASKDGSKLSPSKAGSCVERDFERAPKPDSPTPKYCGSSQWSPQSLTGNAITMQQFTTMLGNVLQRPVIDETGFTAKFDVHLSWIPDQATPGLLAPGMSPPALPTPDDSGPTIFNALAEYLGLKLRAEKGPVDILVIDHAERPSAN